MTEAIEIIEKQLQEVRNKIQGGRARIEKMEANIESEGSLMETLLTRELQLNAAINKLRN